MKTSLKTIIFIFAFLLLFSANNAKAAEDFGPWYAGNFSDAKVFNADIQPFNNGDAKEAIAFQCMTRNGYSLTDDDRTVIGQIIKNAGVVYLGNLDYDDWGGEDDLSDERKDIPNLGYPEEGGQEALEDFLADEKKLLEEGEWTWYSNREAQDDDDNNGTDEGNNNQGTYFIGDSGIVIAARQADEDLDDFIPFDKEQQRKVARFINWQADHPLQLTHTDDLPEGCSLNPFSPDSPDFGAIFDDTGGFFTDLILYLPKAGIHELYEVVHPMAFKWTFWTPHSERGDSIFQTPTSCAKNQGQEGFEDGAVSSACENGEPMGFTKTNLNVGKQDAGWLQMSRFLQWFVSGLYFLILFTSATAYIFRGNRTTNLNVIRLIPRLILSAVLTIFVPFLIGALISFSNTLVVFFFDGVTGARTIGWVNDMLLQIGNISGTDSGLLAGLLEIIIGGATIVFFTAFIIGSILRQVLLIILIVLAPLAMFCLIVPKWQSKFNFWLRALFAVIFLPVILALILKLGLVINPIVADPSLAYGSLVGMGGLMLLVVTLWLMVRALKAGQAYVTGGGAGSTSGALLGAGAGALTQMSQNGAGGGMGAKLLGGAGAAMGASAAAMNMGNSMNSRMTPQAKGALAGGGLNLPSALGGASKNPGAVGKLGSGQPGRLQRNMQNAGLKGMQKRGEMRISQAQATQWKDGLNQKLQAAQQAAYNSGKGPLSAAEKEAIKLQHEAKNGKLMKAGGSYRLRTLDPALNLKDPNKAMEYAQAKKQSPSKPTRAVEAMAGVKKRENSMNAGGSADPNGNALQRRRHRRSQVNQGTLDAAQSKGQELKQQAKDQKKMAKRNPNTPSYSPQEGNSSN